MEHLPCTKLQLAVSHSRQVECFIKAKGCEQCKRKRKTQQPQFHERQLHDSKMVRIKFCCLNTSPSGNEIRKDYALNPSELFLSVALKKKTKKEKQKTRRQLEVASEAVVGEEGWVGFHV